MLSIENVDLIRIFLLYTQKCNDGQNKQDCNRLTRGSSVYTR